MTTRRIDGISYEVERLSLEELRNMQGHLVARHALLTADIEFVETEMMSRTHQALPFDGPELNGAAMDPGFNYETFIRTVNGD